MNFFKKNYIVTAFALIILVVLSIQAVRFINPQKKEVYVGVKIGRALKLESSSKPDITYIKSIKVGEKIKNVLGQNVAEIISVRYYPVWDPNQYNPEWGADQYDIYMVVKLQVNENNNTGNRSFNRFQLSVASPLELEFPSIHVSGTITQIGSSNFDDKSIPRIVYLTKKYSYPWEYDALMVGDYYFDGKEKVFEVLGKELVGSNEVINSEKFGNGYLSDQGLVEPRNYIIVKTRMLTSDINGFSVFSGSQVLQVGKLLNVSTMKYLFNDFRIGSIE